MRPDLSVWQRFRSPCWSFPTRLASPVVPMPRETLGLRRAIWYLLRFRRIYPIQPNTQRVGNLSSTRVPCHLLYIFRKDAHREPSNYDRRRFVAIYSAVPSDGRRTAQTHRVLPTTVFALTYTGKLDHGIRYLRYTVGGSSWEPRMTRPPLGRLDAVPSRGQDVAVKASRLTTVPRVPAQLRQAQGEVPSCHVSMVLSG